jgi:hypothetical protein
VLKTQFLDDAEVRRAPFRGLDFAEGDAEFQGSQVAAGQVVADVGGSQAKFA